MKDRGGETVQVQAIEVIRVIHQTGDGTPGNPVRTEVTYWTKDGRLIAKGGINDEPRGHAAEMMLGKVLTANVESKGNIIPGGYINHS